MSDPDAEPFDEQAFLRLADRVEEGHGQALDARGLDAQRLAHLSKKLVCETIRLRQLERLARERAALLEQGQTLLPLSPATDTNQPPRP